MEEADIGMVGLGVMGQNLALNFADKKYTVAGYDVSEEKVAAFENQAPPGGRVIGARSPDQLLAMLKRPARVFIMVPAGPIVDKVIDSFVPHLQSGAIIIDGGNSHFADTNRRTRDLAGRGVHFIGMGVSGGEEGARHGPSLMPGGAADAWPYVKEMFQHIAAKVEDGTPCCDWVGPDGAGHFVKMVHNGIEYGDMQLICEAYFLMKRALGMEPPELAEVFASWNEGDLNSYLIEITAKIFAMKDEETGGYLVDSILDTAGQKGTGKWTSVAALDMGICAPTIAEAVFARCISALKEERVAAAEKLKGPKKSFRGDKEKFIADIRSALMASKICSYAQGFALLQGASDEFGWKLNLGDISLLWREGCIIRAAFLGKIKEAYSRKKPANLLLNPYFKREVRKAQVGWRRVLIQATKLGIPVPAFSSALAYFDSYRCDRLPANLLQAQRDFFGAHTYERVDRERGEFFHTEWSP